MIDRAAEPAIGETLRTIGDFLGIAEAYIEITRSILARRFDDESIDNETLLAQMKECQGILVRDVLKGVSRASAALEHDELLRVIENERRKEGGQDDDD